MAWKAPEAPPAVYEAAVPESRTKVMSRQPAVSKLAWSKRGIRVASWPCHHASIDVTSSDSLFASATKLSAPSEGTATIACTCWPVTMSGRSVAVSPLPHQPAASAPGASQSAAANATTKPALRTRGPPEVKAVLRARTQAPEVRAVEEQDRARCHGAEDDDLGRIAVEEREDRQGDAGRDRRKRRVARRQEHKEPGEARAERDPDGDAEEHPAPGRDHLPAPGEAQEERPPVSEHRGRAGDDPREVVR